jgi:hypothetical protein
VTGAPLQHHYVITVYALDVELNLPSSANFSAAAETLFRALLEAARNDHVLQSSSIGGFHSSAPSNSNVALSIGSFAGGSDWFVIFEFSLAGYGGDDLAAVEAAVLDEDFGGLQAAYYYSC